MSPHALAAACLSMSAAVTRTVTVHDERGPDVHLTPAARQLCECLYMPIVYKAGPRRRG